MSDPDNETSKKAPVDFIKPDVILKIIVDQNFHHDKLIWGQIQTLMALQGAMLAGAYSTQGSCVAVVVTIIGIAFLVLLYLFVERLRDCRDENMALADDIIERYTDKILKEMILPREMIIEKLSRYLRLSRPMKGTIRWDKRRVALIVNGRILFLSAFAIFFVIDIVALGYFICQVR